MIEDSNGAGTLEPGEGDEKRTVCEAANNSHYSEIHLRIATEASKTVKGGAQ
jgi:hypothetical protein